MATLLRVLQAAVFYLLLALWLFSFPALLLPLRLLWPRTSFTIALVWLKGVVVLARFICGLRWRVLGEEHLPNRPAIFACQHQSAWETFFLPTQFNLPMMVVKKELLSIPIFGAYLRYIGMAAIDRKAGVSALKQIADSANAALASGRHVLVFPEGTRVAYGVQGKIQAGIAALYDQCDAPVVPVSHDAGRLWPREGFLKTPGLITVTIHPALPKGLTKQEVFERLQAIYSRFN